MLAGYAVVEKDKAIPIKQAVEVAKARGDPLRMHGAPEGYQNAVSDKTNTEIPELNNGKETQADRAKQNGVHVDTQRKLEYAFTNDPPRFAKIQAGALSISRAYDESRDKVKTPLDKALAALLETI